MFQQSSPHQCTFPITKVPFSSCLLCPPPHSLPPLPLWQTLFFSLFLLFSLSLPLIFRLWDLQCCHWKGIVYITLPPFSAQFWSRVTISDKENAFINKPPINWNHSCSHLNNYQPLLISWTSLPHNPLSEVSLGFPPLLFWMRQFMISLKHSVLCVSHLIK